MTESNIKMIGNRIKELRDGKKITQADLAKALNVKRETINQWESGSRDLKTQYTVDLATFFGTTCDFILRGIKPENISAYQRTQLSDIAIDHISKITGLLEYFPETTEEMEKIIPGTFTLESKDMLIEILLSDRFAHLILSMIYLSKDYSRLIKITPMVNINVLKFENFPDSITEVFNYRLWRTANIAQNIISDILKSYYLKTKDGIAIYKFDLNHNIIKYKESE